MAHMTSTKFGSSRKKEEMPKARFGGCRVVHVGYRDVRYELSFYNSPERSYELIMEADEMMRLASELLGLDRKKLEQLIDMSKIIAKAD